MTNKYDINTRLDDMIKLDLIYHNMINGLVCPKCEKEQGIITKGFPFYCNHYENKLDRFLIDIKKQITEQICEFMTKKEDTK